MLTPQQWHAQFLRQAGWTEFLRRHLFQKLGFSSSSCVLEVGCGTGAITADLHAATHAQTIGLDLNRDFLLFAAQHDASTRFTAGDARSLPFAQHTFTSAVCHYFLLWMSQPLQALAEMRRVVKPGGWVVALAEPDHAGRIDYPVELAELGRLQTLSLQQQGADPFIGRRLASLFSAAGLTHIECGVLGGQWAIIPTPRQDNGAEWSMLAHDLASQVSPDALAAYRRLDEYAWSTGSRILYIPTFYALGQVP